jgi:hypothetical protein
MINNIYSKMFEIINSNLEEIRKMIKEISDENSKNSARIEGLTERVRKNEEDNSRKWQSINRAEKKIEKLTLWVGVLTYFVIGIAVATGLFAKLGVSFKLW